MSRIKTFYTKIFFLILSSLLIFTALRAQADVLEHNDMTSELHAEAAKKQTPRILENIRRSEFYKYFGRGKINFSNSVVSKYRRFKSNPDAVIFFVSEDGDNSKWWWCRGSRCNISFGWASSISSKIKDISDEWGSKAYIFEIENNFDYTMGPAQFKGLVVWDFGSKSEKQIALDLEQEKAREQERKAAAEKAAAEKAAAEKAAREAAAEAERARLKSEIAALKEEQRDRLREAFANRSQAQREAIQQRLYERGLYQSTVDGVFGTGTRAAIEEYARPNNKIDVKTNQGAEAVIAELLALQPSTTGVVIVAAKGRAPLDLSKQSNAKLYLDDVREFVALNPKELDPLFLASSYSHALQEIQNQTFNKTGSSFLKLVAYTRSSAPFREYHEAQSVKRFEAEEGKRTAIAEAIVGHIERLKARVVANPFAADTFQLSQVIQKYQTVPKDADAASLEELRVSLENDLKALGVSVAAAAAPSSGSGNAAPTKTSAVDLKALSDIGAKDIVVLANLGRDAPYAFRDLKGEIAFEGKIVNACAPSLAALTPQYRAFYEAEINKTLADHKFNIETRCREGLKGLDVLIVSGTDLAKSQDIPPADALVASLNKKTLGRLVTIKHSDFTRELAKRDILSAQYESDIREGARVGYGALAFKSDTKVGCTVIDEGIEGHDTSIEAALSALQFLSGAVVKETTNVSATVAFRQAQKGQCAVIYASSATLKTILEASKSAGIAPTVLPVWTTASAIAQRAKELSSKQASKMQSEAERLADLKKRQAEAAAKRQAEEAQLEERQRRYRAQHGAKVASLVSSIDGQLKEVRDQIDGALNARKNVDVTLGSASFWGVYPKWYADKRMKGWDFDSTVPEPRDYGVAKWRGREVEAVTAQIRVLMKNRKLGEYSDDCWNVGYIIDGEFSMNREPFVAACKDASALKAWQASNGFETRWDLGQDKERTAAEAAATAAAEAQVAAEARAQAAEDARRAAQAKARQQAEAARQATEEQRRAEAARQAADAARRAEEDRRRQAEADAARRAQEERQRLADAEAARQAAENAQRQAEAARQAEEDRRRQLEAEAARRAAEERQRLAAAEAARRANGDWYPAQYANVTGPGFRCSGNLNPTEWLLCSVPRLSRADGVLSAVYAELKAGLTPDSFATVKAEEIAWLKMRDTSCPDPDQTRKASCLLTIVDRRIATLLEYKRIAGL